MSCLSIHHGAMCVNRVRCHAFVESSVVEIKKAHNAGNICFHLPLSQATVCLEIFLTVPPSSALHCILNGCAVQCCLFNLRLNIIICIFVYALNTIYHSFNQKIIYILSSSPKRVVIFYLSSPRLLYLYWGRKLPFFQDVSLKKMLKRVETSTEWTCHMSG